MISFAQSLEETAGSRRYLLLGNGFSISLFPGCFSYSSLLDEAKNEGLFAAEAALEQAFDLLETTDFEAVMEALKASARLAPLYGHDAARMTAHANLLKEILVGAIAGRHPDRPNAITEEQYQNCRAFLSNFIGMEREKNLAGKVFSLNYDLLLYWSILHDIVNINWDTGKFEIDVDQHLEHDDGFRAPEDNYDAEYVAWDQFSASNSQSVTFLHGALHLYERGPELAKLCWERAGNKPLMDQIRLALDQDRYPLFVSEGTSRSKMERINKSAYLSKGLRSFAGCCGTKSAALFVIGHSLAANDEHVLRRIQKGKIGQIYVSIFGDPTSPTNLDIRARAEALANARPEKVPLEVEFVDAATLHIWDH